MAPQPDIPHTLPAPRRRLGRILRSPAERVTHPHAIDVEAILDAYGVDPDSGLPVSEVEPRRTRFGRNTLRTRKGTSKWTVLLDQIRSAVVLLLLAAVVAGFAIGEVIEAIAVLIVLIVNTIVGFLTEYRAIRSMEALRSLATAVADVERDDRRDEIDAVELVPGDIVSVEAGDRVPADIRLIEVADLTVEESALTGESEAVRKTTEPVAPEAGIGDRTNMVFMGTTIQSGRGRGVVVATGSDSEVGRIADLADTADTMQAPLQVGLERLGRVLSVVVVILAGALAALGFARGLEVDEVLEVSIALAVAIVPEGLPAVATLTLTVGMRRMARQQALVRRLPVVETLGSTTVIASDKTGTLTANRMEVVDTHATLGAAALWESAVLCNDSDIAEDGDPIGDPTEVALLAGATAAGVDFRSTRERSPREREVPFDSDTKRMAVQVDGVVHVKGAAEALLDAEEDASLLEVVEAMSNRALRTLVIGRRPAPPTDAPDDELFCDLELLGVVGIEDPPRPEAIDAVRVCHQAGIRVVMITGDQPRTAAAIAAQLGMRAHHVLTGRELAAIDDEELAERIVDVDVFARVAPDQKLRIVRALQADGEVVAVTGDGVNDAPALRQADVGVAMGGAGTDVAREAADIVLTDDDFATIEHAVAEGRRIFANIRRFAQFLFSWHLSVVLIVTTSIALGLPAPLAGLMVLWNNLIIDVIPSFALALEPGDRDAMREPPRPKDEPVLGSGTVKRIIYQGLLVGSVGFVAYLLGREHFDLALDGAQTLTFVTLTSAQLLAVFNARSERGSGFRGARRNLYLWGALGITLLLEAVALTFPPLRDVLGLTTMPAEAWLAALLLAPIPLVATQLFRWVRRSEGDRQS